MKNIQFFFFLVSINFDGKTLAAKTFSAVVMEYAPLVTENPDSPPNLQDNVNDIVNIIENAKLNYKADLIVFPENSLTRFKNVVKRFTIPDPVDKVRLCNTTTLYDSILSTLACATNSTNTYVLVNLVENYYNTTLKKNLYFNTDVVFDPNGIIVARYRKIHLFGEFPLTPSPDKELVYFDTNFGVRFGILTCFDIIFKDPGVMLAKNYNITHFLFPTHWFSQLPFLTGIQEQYYFAYTLDVILLASEYNNPSTGSTGTGIYLGRQGPVKYNQTSLKGTFLLHADLPVLYPSLENHSTSVDLQSKAVASQLKTATKNRGFTKTAERSFSKFHILQDDLNSYTTEPIKAEDNEERLLEVYRKNSSEVAIQFTINRILCQNSFCCNFSVNVTAKYSRTKSGITRADDYSQLYYRFAVFDGVKNYLNVDTGGLQTCAIISCVNNDLSSCGVTSDSSSAVPYSVSGLYQSDFLFESISITGNFSNKDSFVGPNVLLRGEDEDNFGDLLYPDKFVFSQSDGTAETTWYSFQTIVPTRIVTASLYGRLFFRDGKPYTTPSSGIMYNVLGI